MVKRNCRKLEGNKKKPVNGSSSDEKNWLIVLWVVTRLISRDVNANNDSVLKKKSFSSSLSHSVLHVHLHLSFLLSKVVWLTQYFAHYSNKPICFLWFLILRLGSICLYYQSKPNTYYWLFFHLIAIYLSNLWIFHFHL